MQRKRKKNQPKLKVKRPKFLAPPPAEAIISVEELFKRAKEMGGLAYVKYGDEMWMVCRGLESKKK